MKDLLSSPSADNEYCPRPGKVILMVGAMGGGV